MSPFLLVLATLFIAIAVVLWIRELRKRDIEYEARVRQARIQRWTACRTEMEGRLRTDNAQKTAANEHRIARKNAVEELAATLKADRKECLRSLMSPWEISATYEVHGKVFSLDQSDVRHSAAQAACAHLDAESVEAFLPALVEDALTSRSCNALKRCAEIDRVAVVEALQAALCSTRDTVVENRHSLEDHAGFHWSRSVWDERKARFDAGFDQSKERFQSVRRMIVTFGGVPAVDLPEAYR